MKNQNNIQNILNTLVLHLEHSVTENLDHVLGLKEKTPLENFLSSLKKQFPNDYNEALFTKIYNEAFYTGPIPKNTNHVAIICVGHNSKQDFPKYQLWINLDKIATTLIQHYKMEPSTPLFTKYRETDYTWTAAFGSDKYNSSVRCAVNSNWSPAKVSSLLLSGTILMSMTSGYLFLLGTLALTALITINTTGIGLLFTGAVVAASIASYCFFQDKKQLKLGSDSNTKAFTLKSISPNTLKPISIETAFRDNMTEKLSLIDERTSNEKRYEEDLTNRFNAISTFA